MRHLLYLYLHGFVSSPQSTKATFLADKLAAHQLALNCPDLNLPDFSTLTVTRMIRQVEGRARDKSARPGRTVWF